MESYVLVLCCLATTVSLGYCGNSTVTEEAWFEVEVKDLEGADANYRGRFTVALFGDVVPMTALNFVSLAKGFKRGKKVLSYKGSLIHRVVTDFVLQLGDVTKKDGSSGTSIYGGEFVDENFMLSHRGAGWLSMANHGKDTNGSQFFVLLSKARWLDGKHVVFGKVIQGMEVIRTLGELEVDSRTSQPVHKAYIVDCGVNDLASKYDLTEEQLGSTEDL